MQGVLIAITLFFFLETLTSWSFRKRLLPIWGHYLVLCFWAPAVVAPGTIDGIVYMRPEITAYAHLKVQPEILGQGLALAAWLALWVGHKQPHSERGDNSSRATRPARCHKQPQRARG